MRQATAAELRKNTAGIIRAPRRMPVAEAVHKYMRVPVGVGNPRSPTLSTRPVVSSVVDVVSVAVAAVPSCRAVRACALSGRSFRFWLFCSDPAARFIVSTKPTFTKMNISGANGMIPAFSKGINHADRLRTGVNK